MTHTIIFETLLIVSIIAILLLLTIRRIHRKDVKKKNKELEGLMLFYKNAWTEQNQIKQGYMDRQKRQVETWQNKFNTVRHENNKIRKENESLKARVSTLDTRLSQTIDTAMQGEANLYKTIAEHEKEIKGLTELAMNYRNKIEELERESRRVQFNSVL
jgi:predicted RNase H-like nuclease (RuvC/YqgF family)